MSILIRSMTIADYDAVFELWTNTEHVGLSDADSRAAIAAYLDRNPGLSQVAWHEDRIVGAVLCGHDGRRGYLHHLAVAASHRRQGIGTRLIDACLKLLHDCSIQKCHLFLLASNPQGRDFWLQQGWFERIELEVLSCHTKRGLSPVAD